ncbi:hypothetical protein C8F01DRAFT_1326188 [Mycena amicta]|nr:hypothetical protein C8F01DRAFT_1326188 [Mycena amicta]
MLRRSLRNGNAPNQGSAFHELIVAPTLTPDLARPYTDPITGEIIQPHIPQDDSASSPHASDGQPESDEEIEAISTQDKPRRFFVHVTTSFTEVKHDQKARSGKGAKKVTGPGKLVADTVDVFGVSRTSFIILALTSHDLADLYAPGEHRGPTMSIYWTGTKTAPNSVETDTDWTITIQKFRAASAGSKKMDTVYVGFDLDAMDGFRQRAKRPYSPDPFASELTLGPRVPNIDYATPEQRVLAKIIIEIQAHHACSQHGYCFIDEDGRHIVLNNLRLKAMAEAVVSNECIPQGPPPVELLRSWGCRVTSIASGSRPRGRNGPNAIVQPVPAAPPASTNDTTNMLMLMMMQTMAKQQGIDLPSKTASAAAPLADPPSPPAPTSSPPPPVSDELELCMNAFQQNRNIPHHIVALATAKLRDLCFTPGELCDEDITMERIMEITGMTEGVVRQLRKYAARWMGKVEAKRVRRGLD